MEMERVEIRVMLDVLTNKNCQNADVSSQFKPETVSESDSEAASFK